MPWDFAIWPALAVALACMLDRWLGEPQRYHPLVIFGAWADKVRCVRWFQRQTPQQQRLAGAAMLASTVLPWVLVAALLTQPPAIGELLSVVLLYGCIGHQSLREHVLPIASALKVGDTKQARALASRIVSRDPEKMDPTKAAIESTLENGTDGVFATIFWFLVAGAPGAVLYRLVNTLDAMWGYKTAEFLHIGWAAARLDDLLNYVPARLTAVSYALLGNTRSALRCWKTQAHLCASPNGGPVMCAGAGALQIELGGPTWYHGQCVEKPVMGEGKAPDADSILAALQLVKHTLLLWIAAAFAIGFLESGL
ncbi:adenosylcobinamide-phosphate synthase CbiB [Neptunomonas sp. XY-337]|uniref:adenosylcobinamide-phosphate synthase CbiB n=1 Tax=Neptunomonas sp. XY-337 TaxID=2561897 RepID=UPI00197D9483|nr:adenosylcobinamide-phosphate synthase CbiB [Neptunomonas sp. XY-337]